jgi:hypothetical protein
MESSELTQRPDPIRFALAGRWQDEAEALVDEHHLVAVSREERDRAVFAAQLSKHMQRLSYSEVSVLQGRWVDSLDALAYSLSRTLPVDELIEPDLQSVLRALRTAYPRTRRRFLIWHDAHVMAERDKELFWQISDLLMGVAAELEYATEERLLLTRIVFTGEPALCEHPAFQSWYREGPSEPLWQVVSGLPTPPTLVAHLERK